MIKLMLNLHKFNNYAFFCPVSRLHLTVSNPVGFTDEVTSAILKALKAETILDVDNVINLETGSVESNVVPQTPVVNVDNSNKSDEQMEPEQSNDGNTEQNSDNKTQETLNTNEIQETSDDEAQKTEETTETATANTDENKEQEEAPKAEEPKTTKGRKKASAKDAE